MIAAGTSQFTSDGTNSAKKRREGDDPSLPRHERGDVAETD